MKGPWRTAGAVVASVAVLYFLRDLPGRVAALEVVRHPWLSRGSLPMGPETDGGWPSPWLYLALPLVVAAAAVLWIAPGFLATRSLHGEQTGFRRRLVDALGGSLVIQGVVGAALVQSGFEAEAWSLAAGMLGVGGLLGLFPVKRSEPQPRPPRFRFRALLTPLFLLFVTVTVLLPVIFWQDFNPDGFEVFHAGVSLAHAPWPQWPGEAPLAGLGTGGITLAYPTAWFLTWFGPIDAAARLPLVVALPVLHGTLMELIAWKSVRRPGFLVGTALAVALASVTAALVFSGGYDPHLPDAASPAALDLLFLALLAGVFLNLMERRWLMTAILATLALFTRPTTVMVLGVALVAGVIFLEEHRWSWVARGAIALAAALVAGYVYEKVYIPSVLGAAGSGTGAASLPSRLRYLNFTDLRRFLYAALPAGIVPAYALTLWKGQDGLARVLTVVTAAVFLVFYLMAFVTLQHFAPVMVLPLVVYWRVVLNAPRPLVVPAAVLAIAGGALGCFFGLPLNAGPHRPFRELSYEVAPPPTGADGLSLDQAARLLARRIVIPELGNPHHARAVARIILHDAKTEASTRPRFRFLAPGSTVPPGFRVLANDEFGWSLLGRVALAEKDLMMVIPPVSYEASVYRVPLKVRFRHLGVPAHRFDLDLKEVLR